MRRTLLMTAIGLLAAVATAAAETLVTMDAAGTAGPGLALSWSAGAAGVRFNLKPGVKASDVQAGLQGKLGEATVGVIDESTIEIAGLPEKDLLGRLAFVDIRPPAAEADPFAALSQGGGSIALAVPDGSSSLRAKRRADLSAAQPDDPELFSAVVVEVTKMPGLTDLRLTVKVRRAPAAGQYREIAAAGKQLTGLVKLAASSKDGRGLPLPDLADLDTLRNFGAFYLAPGDQIWLSIAGLRKEGPLFDRIERR